MTETPSARHHGDDDARGMHTNFAVNVQGTSPHPDLVAHLAAELPTLGNYPSSTRLAQATRTVAEWLGAPPDRVLLVAGAAEGFSLLAELQPSRAFVFDPGFAEPRDTLSDQNIPVTTIHCGPAPIADGYLLRAHYPLPPLESRGAAGAPMLIVSNPTNPLGQCFTAQQLLEMAEGLTLVADEAFADVSPDAHSLIGHAADDDTGRIIVLRSLTKTHNLAGLRCGVVIAHPDTLAILARRRPHWALSSLQLAAFEWVATHTTRKQLHDTAARIAADRAHLVAEMSALGFVPVGDSGAPYVTFRVPATAPRAEDLRLGLRQQGIAVRRCDTFAGLGPTYWRLAVKDAAHTHTLTTSLRTLL